MYVTEKGKVVRRNKEIYCQTFKLVQTRTCIILFHTAGAIVNPRICYSIYYSVDLDWLHTGAEGALVLSLISFIMMKISAEVISGHTLHVKWGKLQQDYSRQ